MVSNNSKSSTDLAVLASISSHREQQASISSEMTEFQNSIAAKGYLIRGNTPADGNCFFHAMTDQLALVNQTHSFSTLRADLVTYIENLPQVNIISFKRHMKKS